MKQEIEKNQNEINVWGKLEEIRKVFAPTLTGPEFTFFVGLGRSMNANPFKREIWAVKYDSKKPANVFLARDFYRKIAQKQPSYKVHQSYGLYENDKFTIKNGMPDHEISFKNRGKLIGAYAVLWKKNIEIPFIKTVLIGEYHKGQSTWNSMPETMICKVAEAQILKMAYQDDYSGVYSEDEQKVIETSQTSKYDDPIEVEGEEVTNETPQGDLFNQNQEPAIEHPGELFESALSLDSLMQGEINNPTDRMKKLQQLTSFTDKKSGKEFRGISDINKFKSEKQAKIALERYKTELGI